MLPSKRGSDDLTRFSADNKRSRSGEEETDPLISGPRVLPILYVFFNLWLKLNTHVCL
jgi:hypothetical protein